MARSRSDPQVAFRRHADLPGVHLRVARYGEQTFRRHAHDTYCVVLILEGRTRIDLRTGSKPVTAGQLLVLHPEEAHSCNPEPDHGLSYRMFYIAREWFESVASEICALRASAPRFLNQIIEDPKLFRSWEAMHISLMEDSEPLEKESMLVENLAWLVERHAAAGRAGPVHDDGDAVGRAREMLSADLREQVSLSELARAVGMSRYHLLRRFKEATGLPPHTYRMQRRIDHAKQLLAKGVPIVEVALESGFSDQSHLTRSFRDFEGATPSQYRAGMARTV